LVEAVVVWEAMQAVWKAKDDGRHAQFESLAAAVEDAAHRLLGYSDTRGVNGPELVARIAALSPLQELALIDAMERLRVRIFTKGWAAWSVMLREVGLNAPPYQSPSVTARNRADLRRPLAHHGHAGLLGRGGGG